MKATDRRAFIAGSTALATAALLGAPSVGRAAKATTILGIFPLTGPYADTGPLMSKAAEMALKEVDYEVAGQKLRYVTRDSETKAGSATRRAEEAIASDDVKYIVGPWSSGVALAVGEVAKKQKVVHWFSGGTEDISGKRCHRYAFQWAASPWTAMDVVLATTRKEHPKAKRLYLFIVDYAFGWSLQKYVETLAPSYGFTVVGVDRHPLGQREYSSYITKAAAANPDAIYMVNFGLDTVSAVRQLHNFGLIPRIPVILSWSAGVEELVQMSPEMRQNMIVGTNFYYTIDTPVARKFVAEYRKQDASGRPPGYAPGAAYGCMRMVLAGMRAAKSTDVPAVIKATEELAINDLVGAERVVARNHQTLRPYFVLKTTPKAQMKDEYDFGTIVNASAKEQPRELNECKDIGAL
jgi:branched-chain amino acid transport system substrate-binding protein